MTRRQPQPGAIDLVARKLGADANAVADAAVEDSLAGLDDVLARVGAEDGVGARQGDRRLPAVARLRRGHAGQALRKAPRDHDAPDPPGVAQVQHVLDGVDRFGARGLKKAAGVDDDDVGVGGFLAERPAGGRQPTENDLGVDEVLRAAEADERDLLEAVDDPWHRGRILRFRR